MLCVRITICMMQIQKTTNKRVHIVGDCFMRIISAHLKAQVLSEKASRCHPLKILLIIRENHLTCWTGVYLCLSHRMYESRTGTDPCGCCSEETGGSLGKRAHSRPGRTSGVSGSRPFPRLQSHSASRTDTATGSWRSWHFCQWLSVKWQQ